jgi:hypothetical protein
LDNTILKYHVKVGVFIFSGDDIAVRGVVGGELVNEEDNAPVRGEYNLFADSCCVMICSAPCIMFLL